MDKEVPPEEVNMLDSYFGHSYQYYCSCGFIDLVAFWVAFFEISLWLCLRSKPPVVEKSQEIKLSDFVSLSVAYYIKKIEDISGNPTLRKEWHDKLTAKYFRIKVIWSSNVWKFESVTVSALSKELFDEISGIVVETKDFTLAHRGISAIVTVMDKYFSDVYEKIPCLIEDTDS